MKGNYFLGSRQFQVREMSFPPLGDFEVKIQNMAAGICGTDIHIYHGEKGPRRLLLRWCWAMNTPAWWWKPAAA